MNNRIFIILSLLSALLWGTACSSSGNKPANNHQQQLSSSARLSPNTPQEVNYLTLSVINNAVPLGKPVVVRFAFSDSSVAVDSVVWYRDGHYQGKMSNFDSLQISTTTTGMHQITLHVFYKGQQEETDAFSYTVYAARPPKSLTWKVVNEYPHSPTAYTQGLFFADGYLYEGTGEWGQSALKKINLKTGEVLQSYNLDNTIFGEGIVKYKDKIIQLTWQSHEAFVYDYKTFRLINRFSYDTEGWGITNYGDNLIMSDGSNRLYVLDPNSFLILRTIQVYNDKAPVSKLNELENIHGRIFANVYLSNTIVVINPQTGAVTHTINLKGILPQSLRTKNTDVLNGIAWNEQTNQLVVTGKNWPRLYEIKLNGIDLTSGN